MGANALLERLKRVFDVGNCTTKRGKSVYISMCEGSVCSMRLSFCYVHQKHQFFFPLVDLFSDELVNKPDQ